MAEKWISPANDGIYLSCILRPDILPNEVSKITLVAAVGAVLAIRDFSGLNALIKWPNDILISDRKVGGILTELKGEMDKVEFVILGIGINVNTPKSVLPKEASSFKSERGISADLSLLEFVKILLKYLDDEYIIFRDKGFDHTREELKRYSCTLGRNVTVTTSVSAKVHGKAIDINDKGALVVQMEDGKEETFLSGDVVLTR